MEVAIISGAYIIEVLLAILEHIIILPLQVALLVVIEKFQTLFVTVMFVPVRIFSISTKVLPNVNIKKLMAECVSLMILHSLHHLPHHLPLPHLQQTKNFK